MVSLKVYQILPKTEREKEEGREEGEREDERHRCKEKGSMKHVYTEIIYEN